MAYFDYSKPFKKGSELTADEQREVLASYVHRYTSNNVPSWAKKEWKDGQPYPLQFVDDRDWLEHTLFQVTPAGRLDRCCNECQSTPTWPNNPELRKTNHGEQQ